MPNISYTGRDARLIKQELVRAIPLLTRDWTDFHVSDPGMALVDLISYVGDNLSFYLDRMALESIYETAQERKNILSSLKMFGYIPRGYNCAQTSVKLRSAHSHEIYIKEYDVFTTDEEDGEVFYFVATEDVTLPPVEWEMTEIPLMEGIKREYLLEESNLDTRKRFNLGKDPLGENSIRLFVDGVEWQRVPEIYFNTAQEGVFGLDYDPEGTLYLKLPRSYILSDPGTVSPEFKIVALETIGSRANFGQRTITKIISDLEDEFGNTDCVKYIADILHEDYVSGGDNPESVEEIRKNAPKKLRSLWTACTLQDFEDLAETFPGISKALALDWSIEGSGIEEAYIMDLIIVPKGDGNVSSLTKDALKLFLMERRIAPLKFSILDPEFNEIDVEVVVTVRRTFQNRASLRFRIIDFIKDYFLFEKRSFGEVIRPVELRKAIEEEFDPVLYAEILDPEFNVVLSLREFARLNSLKVTVVEEEE